MRQTRKMLAAVAAVLAACLMAACGGSDEPLPDDTKGIGPVDCVNHPQRCV